MPSSHEWTRVVVLRPAAHGPLDEHLKSAFSQREWFAIEHTDPHQAMAELCLREKAQAARASWGLQRVEKSALLIIDPFEFSAARALITAAQRYVPGASIWTFAEGEFTAVGKACENPISTHPHRQQDNVAPQPVAPAATPRRSPVSPVAPSPPSDEVAEASFSPTSESDEEPIAAAVRISREEIDMLLRAHDEDSEMDERDDVAFSPPGRSAGRGDS